MSVPRPFRRLGIFVVLGTWAAVLPANGLDKPSAPISTKYLSIISIHVHTFASVDGAPQVIHAVAILTSRRPIYRRHLYR